VRVPKPQPVPKGKQVAIKRLDASLADSAWAFIRNSRILLYYTLIGWQNWSMASFLYIYML
jgi:hypothetical protein